MSPPLPWEVPGRLHGIDVSGAQAPNVTMMRAAKAAGCISADVKACDYDISRGLPFMDPTMIRHLANARAADLRVGIYDFFKSGLPWQVQAEQFLRCYELAGALQMRPTIDWEDQARITANPALARDGVLLWCHFVQERTGRRPQIYTGKSCTDILVRAKVDFSGFLDFDLWDAAYRWDPVTGHDYGLTAPAPIVCNGVVWEVRSWQCGGNGAPRIPTVVPLEGEPEWHPVDLDRDVHYFPTIAAFDAYCADAPTREPGLELGDDGPAHPLGRADRAEKDAT